MLGSVNEADDAIQETWLRLSRSDASAIENLGGWLTTVLSRVCLDILRTRTARREEVFDTGVTEPIASRETPMSPEEETVLADSVGFALLIVLNRLEPAERLAFVLHDMFAVSFDEIASIVGRSPEAARQLASRARRRVQGEPTVPRAILTEKRKVADAFLAALRAGDLEALVNVLDPDVLVRLDETAARPGKAREVRGARKWAHGAIVFSRNFQGLVLPMLVDGDVGLVWAPRGGVLRALRLSIADGRVTTVDIIGDETRLNELELAPLPE
jgi:RNA polymerase sigma-70 factor (ECF subfamily)